MMNDELKTACLSFIIHHSAFITSWRVYGHSPDGGLRFRQDDNRARACGRAGLEVLRRRQLPPARQRREDGARRAARRRRPGALAWAPPRLDPFVPRARRGRGARVLRAEAELPGIS